MPSYRSIRKYSSKMSKSLEKAFHKIANKDIKSYSNLYVMGYVVTFDTCILGNQTWVCQTIRRI